MLSLNILEKHETDLNKTNSTIEFSPSDRVGTILNDDVLKKIKSQIDEEVTKILNGEYESKERLKTFLKPTVYYLSLVLL